MESTSASLIKRLRNPHDEEAWQRFVDLYVPTLHAWAHRRGLSDSDASDLTQEILVLLLNKMQQFRYDPERSFRGWIRIVAMNKWREMQRRKIKQPEQRELVLEEVPEDEDEFWETELTLRVVNRAFYLLETDFAEKTAQAFRKCAIEGVRPQEVAHSLGITVNAVYLAKSHVLRRLRQELEGLID